MREIKFRAKSLDGDWVYFSLYEVTHYFPSDDVFYVGNLPCKVGGEQEYTGLKDKNGKESYFDDLVAIDKAVFQIVWDNTYGIANLIRVAGEHLAKEMPIFNVRLGEVIGNIYENKELLEVKF